jgi:DNA-directed RNA polymerase subunit RPC12/RpoP
MINFRCSICHREFPFDSLAKAEAKDGEARTLCIDCREAALLREKEYKMPKPEEELPEPSWGTSPMSLARVKMESEEARHSTCPDCGYGAGRHARSCRLG